MRRALADRSAAGDAALTLLLAGLTVLLGFEAGGYFADTTGWVAMGLALGMALSAAAFGRPPAGFTWPLGLAAGLLALFGIWVLVSATWADATAAALIEFDRVLLYLLALLLFGVAAQPARLLRWLPAAFALAAIVLCGAAVLIRTLPDVWPFALPPASNRMDYPVSYENALGALASLGLLFTLHLASWHRYRVPIRALAAAALPLLTVALVLTFSRGATLVAVIGPVAYLVLGRPRGVLTALVAAGPFVFLAAQGALDADLLATADARTSAALDQGEDLALLAGVASLAAGLVMAVLVPVESRVSDRLPRLSRRSSRGLLAGLMAAAVAAVGIAVATGEARDLYNRVVEQGTDDGRQQVRERLTDPRSFTDLSAQSRPKYWRVALDAFERHPVRGNGAGTYPKLWARYRSIDEESAEAHSIYLETLAELGVVGAALLFASLGVMLWPALARLRGSERPLYACMLAAALVWLLHAALDWDWEMPVLTLWLFAMGGCALAASGPRLELRGQRRWPWRAAVAAGLVLVALTPATVALSQSRLDGSVEALQDGDCSRAEELADDAISVLGLRPEPYEVLAYCSARRGDHALARARMRQALDRDPDDWRLFYGLAIVRARGGLDPRPALRDARARNPRGRLILGAIERFSTADPRAWRRRARSASLPLLGPTPVPTQD